MNHSTSKRDARPSGYIRGTTQLVSHCPVCHTFYQQSTARVLVEQDDAHLIHIECRICHSAIIALVIANVLGVSTVGLLTDLTPEDVLRFRLAESVVTDDVIDLHVLLAEGRLPSG